MPLLFIALVVFLVIYLPCLIRVTSIACKSQFGPCSNSLEGKLRGFEGKNLKEAKKQVTEVLGAETSVTDFSLQFKIPAILKVDILEKKPKFAVKEKDTAVFGLVGQEGTVLKIEKDSSLPFLEIDEKIPGVGERVSDKIFFGLNLVYDLFLQYQLREGKIKDSLLVVDSLEGRRVIFPLAGDREILLGALRLIIGRLNDKSKDTRIVNGASVSEIDLRFKNPVLR
ncbi:MAG: hypothetical protein ACOYT7_03220 [Patescibacteria group bacterium]